MGLLDALVAYFHPPRHLLAALPREGLRKLLVRNAWWFAIGALLSFSVKDPQGDVLVALWDAVVTVSVFASLLEAVRLRWWWSRADAPSK